MNFWTEKRFFQIQVHHGDAKIAVGVFLLIQSASGSESLWLGEEMAIGSETSSLREQNRGISRLPKAQDTLIALQGQVFVWRYLFRFIGSHRNL